METIMPFKPPEEHGELFSYSAVATVTFIAALARILYRKASGQNHDSRPDGYVHIGQRPDALPLYAFSVADIRHCRYMRSGQLARRYCCHHPGKEIPFPSSV
jgi:hypothetical protein